MDAMSAARGIVLIGTAYLMVVHSYRYLAHFRYLSDGQRFFVGSALFFMVTAAWDTAIFLFRDDPFRWRIVPHVIAITLAMVYSMEPSSRLRMRFGQDIYAHKRPGN